MIPLTLALVLIVVSALVTAAVIFSFAYEMGHDAGWDQGFGFAESETQVRFRKSFPPEPSEPPVVSDEPESIIYDLYHPEITKP